MYIVLKAFNTCVTPWENIKELKKQLRNKMKRVYSRDLESIFYKNIDHPISKNPFISKFL
jgi:hypothetical protein